MINALYEYATNSLEILSSFPIDYHFQNALDILSFAMESEIYSTLCYLFHFPTIHILSSYFIDTEFQELIWNSIRKCSCKLDKDFFG